MHLLHLATSLALILAAFVALASAAQGRRPGLHWRYFFTALDEAGKVELRNSKEAAEACMEAVVKVNDLRSIEPDKRDKAWEAELREASNALADLNREFDTITSLEQDFVQRSAWDAAVRGEGEPGGGPAAGTRTVGDAEARSPGDQVVESDVYEARNRESGVFGGVEVRNLLTGTSLGTSGSHLFAPVGQPIPPQPRQRRLFVRDLLTVQSTGLNSIPYIRELNPATTETGADTVQEASAKPEVTMTFESADAPVRKIAAWVQATMEAIEDAPTLAGYINTRLAYMLLVEEEAQVLAGDGNAPNLEGITVVTGTQDQNAVANDLPATVGLSIAKVENVDGFADGVALNPIDFWTGVVERFSSQMDVQIGGSSTNPYGQAIQGILGLPAVRTRSLSQGDLIVGNWSMGATLMERSGTTIRSTDSHASLFISNTVVILAEERVALPIWRPDYFVIVDDVSFS